MPYFKCSVLHFPTAVCDCIVTVIPLNAVVVAFFRALVISPSTVVLPEWVEGLYRTSGASYLNSSCEIQ